MKMSGPFRAVYWVGVIGLGVILLACGNNRFEQAGGRSTVQRSPSTPEPTAMSPYNPSQSVSSDDAGTTPAAVLDRQALMIAGNIVQIMESYPLQLMVETNAGCYQVALSEQTQVTQQGQTIEQTQLKVGMQVQIEGQTSSFDDHAMTAQVIQIQ